MARPPHPDSQERVTRVVLMDPARSPRVILTKFIDFECNLGLFGQDTFRIKMPFGGAWCTSVYDSQTALAARWKAWSIDFYWQGQLAFSGPVVNVTLEHQGHTGTAYGTLECCSWLTWFLNSRTVETGNHKDYAVDAAVAPAHWDDIWLGLVGAQLDPDLVSTPSGYPAAATRSNCGPFVVQVEAGTGASPGTTTYWRIERNKPLGDTARQLCNEPEDDEDKLMPTITESPAGTFTIGVLVGRSGASRAIGADKTDTVVVSGYRSGIAAAKLEFDHEPQVSVWRINGNGKEDAQLSSFIYNADVYSWAGIREDSMTIRGASKGGECDAEGHRRQFEAMEEACQRQTYQLSDIDSYRFLVDFEMYDTITLADAVLGTALGATVTDGMTKGTITQARFSYASPGPMRIEIGFGRLPRSDVRDAQSSGGGGRGGGRGGGNRGKPTRGEPKTDPDTIVGPKTITGDSGSGEFDSAEDALSVVGNPNASGGSWDNITTLATDDPEEIQIAVVVGPCQTIEAEPYCWVPFDLDTDGDGDADLVVYVPVYTNGGGLPNNPPTPSA